ncbi:hypothetical protein PG996_002566 [Apiospora saccharicola]|uniref:NACHT domain-containing protein n=1 Tax=Apiospora saccharicola TaxID=335842 RepID=A0ABR1WJU0_9PEZI
MSFASDSVFKAAQDAFRATLSTKDQARYVACNTPDELVISLRELETLAKKGQKTLLGRCLTTVNKLNTRLQVYFDALNVVAGAHDAAALAYGALASVLPTFFDRLLSVIERLANAFPQYEAILDVFDGKPTLRMQQHIEKVYQDFFRFLKLAAKVISSSNGRIKRPVELIANVIWKPFDVTFRDILAQMTYHRGFILEELDIYRAQRSKDAYRAASLERVYAEQARLLAEEDRRRAKEIEDLGRGVKQVQEREFKCSSVRRIEDWLAPPLFAETLESSQEHRIENTARWIFKKDEFKKWASMEVDFYGFTKQKMMPPGFFGRMEIPGAQLGQMVCYFFFRYTDRKSSTIEAAYRSALAQILHRYREDDDILDKFMFIQSDSNSSSCQSCATTKQVHDLLRICAETLGRIDFIVDGIDEADDPNDVIERLRALVTTAPIKLICFSRPNVSRLQYLVPAHQRIVFSRDLTGPDIHAFLESEIIDLIEEAVLPATANINSLLEPLLSGADGMFLWAKLITRYLRSPALSRTARLRLIHSVRMPEGLDAMYNRIASLIMESSEPELKLAKDVLPWVRHPKSEGQRVGIDCLRTAVGHDSDPEEKDDFVDAVISVCCGLVEFTNRRGFNLTHLTVIEYFEKKWSTEGSKEVVIPNIATTTPELTLKCVEHIMESAPSKLPLDRWSRNIYGSNEVMLRFQSWFEAYATAEWVNSLASIPHEKLWELSESVGGTYEADISRLKGVVARFLGSLVAAGLWIENLYALGKSIHDIVQSLRGFTWVCNDALHIADQGLKTQLVDVAGDLLSVENEWGSTLLKTPHLIWTDVILFTKLKTLSRFDTSSFGTAYSLAPEDVKDSRGCNQRTLCSISSTSSDARMTAVLCIVPPVDLKQLWRGHNGSYASIQEESLGDGWVAKYDVWAQGSRSQLASLQIPLPREEVSIILRQSFRKVLSNPKGFEISFPLAIGPDCHTIAVLRTVYGISTDQSKSTTTYHSSRLPLEHISDYHNKWGKGLQPFNPWRTAGVPVIWANWYTYSLTFSPGNKMLCFADYKRRCQVNLAVFEIHHVPTLRLQCIRLTRVTLGSPGVSEMHFHPMRSLLIFLAETKVWMWDFGAILEDATPAYLETEFDKCNEKPHSLSFSETPCDTGIVEDERAAKRKRSADEPEPSSSPSIQLRLIGGQDLQGRTLSGAHLSMTGTAPSILTIVPGGNTIGLEMATPSRQGEKIRRQLVTLPDALNTDDKAIRIKLPEIPDEPLQIFLNKSAKMGYALEKNQHVYRPMVIEKNVRLVETRLTITTSGNLAVDQPPQKRFCLPPHPAAIATEGSTATSHEDYSVLNVDVTFENPDQQEGDCVNLIAAP